MTNYNSTNPYGDYETKGEDPYSLLMKMSSWNKELRSTISDVKYELDETVERQSQILQDVDQIQINVTNIDSRVGKAESSITVMAGEINLKATIVQVDKVNQRLIAAEGEISTQAGLIALKANTTVVDGINSRISTAEVRINSMDGTISSKVSYTDYNGNEIVSLINQNAWSVTIAAQAIDMYGIVRVNNALELGMSGNGMTKAIKFNGTSAWIYSDGDNLTIDASYLNVRSRADFYSDVDFSRATVRGLYARFG